MKPSQKHLGKISLTLYYLQRTTHMQYFGSQAVHISMVHANDYYRAEADPEFSTKKEAILTKHGYTHEQWDDLLNSSFYFSLDPNMDACNKEVQTLVKSYVLMNGTNYGPNYTASMITNSSRQSGKHILRKRVGNLWYYRLSDDLYQYIGTLINNQKNQTP